MIIDSHAHIIVSEILRDAASSGNLKPRVIWENGQQIIEFNGKRITSAIREIVSIERILLEMDRAGVDAVLLSPWISLIKYGTNPDEVLDACQIQNDALSALAKKYPKRVSALGVVPMQNISLAIKELERLMLAGLKGVEVGTNVNGVYLGDPGFRPLWEACQALGAIVFIHPLEGGGRAEFKDHYMWNVIGNPMETTIAAGHMILSGVMDAYPRLKVLLAHGGGTLPFIHGRLDRGYKTRAEINEVISKPPTEYLKQFYFDTVTHDPVVLCNLVEFAGADHVLLGSDYPFDMGNENPVELVHSAGLSPDVEKMILGDNAIQLLSWSAKS